MHHDRASTSTIIDSLQASRRAAFRSAIGATILASGASLIGTSAAKAQAARPSDNDVLNFALNLEYLTANLFAFATTGSSIPADAQSGSTARVRTHCGERRDLIQAP